VSASKGTLLVQEGRRDAPGGRSHIIDRTARRLGCVSDHPVRAFQSRTPLLFQEGIFARRHIAAPRLNSDALRAIGEG